MGVRNNVAKFWLICGGFRQPLHALIRNGDSPMRLWTSGEFAGNPLNTQFVRVFDQNISSNHLASLFNHRKNVMNPCAIESHS